MEKDDQNRLLDPSPAAGRRTRRQGVTIKLTVLALTLVSVAAAAGFFMAPLLRQESDPSVTPPAGPPTFSNWPKPDVALMLSGEQYGYMQPCGCSEPQKGGLARRYNFLQSLAKRGWPVVSADVGDIAQESGPQKQIQLKFEYSMKALGLMNYSAVGVGKNEANLPLGEGLAATVLNNKDEPRAVVTNLVNREKEYPEMIEPWAVGPANGNAPVVGFAGIVGPGLANELKKTGLQFAAEEKVLPQAIRQLQAQKAELLVLLYQGDIDEAKACARKFPEFRIILHMAKEPEPSSEAVMVGTSMLVNPGHKGRYVGVVGVHRNADGQPFTLRYQLVELGPDYETPKGKDKDNPIHALMQQYAEAVRDRNLLAEFPSAPHPVQIAFPGSAYVGTETCKRCHKSAYNIWKEHPHSHAYDTLVNKADRPTQRQFDGECIVCHTTGFGFDTGFRSEKTTPKLLNVGCEACHGPASLHVQNTANKAIRAALNPFKAKPGEDAKKVEDRMFQACFKCHDTDNSVHFELKEYWLKRKTVHPTPEDEKE
ncbi:MAG TPA: multiheme c-type cytochrome [Gemmataceae bacterium]|nr:multiheme c-type cytochrome [Gemmataceae bacterium]